MAWTVGALTTLLDNSGAAPNTLASLAASGAAALGTVIYDNTAGLFYWGEFELAFTVAVAPTAGQSLDLYLVESVDGTNYADATGSNTPASVVSPAGAFVGKFVSRGIATAQRLVLTAVRLPPTKFEAMLVNNTNQALASAATAQTLKLLPYRT